MWYLWPAFERFVQLLREHDDGQHVLPGELIARMPEPDHSEASVLHKCLSPLFDPGLDPLAGHLQDR